VVFLGKKPCCAAAEARKIQQLVINNVPVGLYQLDEIMDEVKVIDGLSDDEIGDILLKRISIYNFVPPKVAQAYREALLAEYGRRCGQN